MGTYYQVATDEPVRHCPPWVQRTIITNTYHSNWFCASESEVFLFLESFRDSQKIKGCGPSPSWAWSQSYTKRKKEASSSFWKALVFVQWEGGINTPNLWELSALVIYRLISNSEYHSSMLTSCASLETLLTVLQFLFFSPTQTYRAINTSVLGQPLCSCVVYLCG